jgi:hypothetical protein
MYLNWEALKERIVRAELDSDRLESHTIAQSGAVLADLALQACSAECPDWDSNFETLKEKVRGIILGWDVRCAKKLIDLFPSYVPAEFRNVELDAWMEDSLDSEWVIAPRTQTRASATVT